MTQKGKFILFDTPEEFKTWLDKQKITRKIKIIQNHHTWSPDYKHFKGNNHFELLVGMENSHLKRDFSQIAQSLTTYPDGKIAVCRDLNIAPAGIYGWNTYGICIEHIGNFDIGGDKMSDVHKDCIVKLNAILCNYFKLDVDKNSVVYHAWFNLSTGVRDNDTATKKGNYKTCAGTNFFGGNSLTKAEENFYPLIRQEIDRMNKPIEIPTQPKDELKEALEFLSMKSNFDRDFWYSEARKIKYLDLLLIKIANAWKSGK